MNTIYTSDLVRKMLSYINTPRNSLYKSNSVGVKVSRGDKAKGGRKLKGFYDELCRHIFDINLNLLEQIREFPITYSERSNSAAIAMALSRLTPYVISEYGVDCKGVDLREDESQNEKQRRTIDFWCATEGNNGLDIWINLSIYGLMSAKGQKEHLTIIAQSGLEMPSHK